MKLKSLISSQRRAQAQIITVVLIILIVIVGLIIVWNVVQPLIEKSSGQAGAGAFSYKAEIKLFNVEPSYATIEISRGAGGKEIIGVKFIFEDTSGMIYSYENKTDLPDELETKTYVVGSSDLGITDFSNIEKVGVYFIYEVDGAERISMELDSAKRSLGGLGDTCPVGGVCYYIDSTNGDDIWDGNISYPWKTIAKVNGESFNPGDYILFKRGEVWREQLNVLSFGSAGSPITFGAYGVGEKPIINGADVLKGWNDEGEGVYSKGGISYNPQIVVYNGNVLNYDVGANDNVGFNDWDWNDSIDTLYVNVGENPDNGDLEAGMRKFGIDIRNNWYITVQDIEFMHQGAGYAAGVYINENSHHVTVQNCLFHNIGNRDEISPGMRGEKGDGVRCRGDHNIIQNNTMHHCGHVGVIIEGNEEAGDGSGPENNTVQYNIIYDCYHNLVDVKGITGGGTTDVNEVDIRYNRLYFTDEYDGLPANGIFMRGQAAQDADTTNIRIYYNIFYNTVDDAIQTDERVDNLYIYNNVLYKTGRNPWNCGISLQTDSDFNAVIKNNIGMDGYYCILRIENSSNKIVDNNCWYQSISGGEKISWIDGVTYDDFDGYRSATGFDANSLNENPLFVDAPNNNFHLQPTSPCIDAGIDVSLTEDFEGNSIIPPPDIGAYEYVS